MLAAVEALHQLGQDAVGCKAPAGPGQPRGAAPFSPRAPMHHRRPSPVAGRPAEHTAAGATTETSRTEQRRVA